MQAYEKPMAYLIESLTRLEQAADEKRVLCYRLAKDLAIMTLKEIKDTEDLRSYVEQLKA